MANVKGTLGEIRIFCGNFAPLSWAFCQGQLLPINTENSALYSILGNTYGGYGPTNFAIPDYRGRAPVGKGSMYQQGQIFGNENCFLTVNNLPAHSHSASIDLDNWGVEGQNSNSGRGSLTNEVSGNYPGKPAQNLKIYASLQGIDKMGPMSLSLTPDQITSSTTGKGSGFSIMQPSLAVNYIICTDGNYPTRN